MIDVEDWVAGWLAGLVAYLACCAHDIQHGCRHTYIMACMYVVIMWHATSCLSRLSLCRSVALSFSQRPPNKKIEESVNPTGCTQQLQIWSFRRSARHVVLPCMRQANVCTRTCGILPARLTVFLEIKEIMQSVWFSVLAKVLFCSVVG